MRSALGSVAALLIACGVAGQSAPSTGSGALQRFGEIFQRAVLQTRGGRSADFAQAAKLLDRARELVPELPPAQRAQAEFGVLVRKAWLYQRADKPQRAAEVAHEARAKWSNDPAVWQGSHRAIALVVLWASLPLERFLAAASREDREFLLSDACDRYRGELVGALDLARADLLLLSPATEANGVALVQHTWQELRALAAGGSAEAVDAWRVLCAQRLFAFHFERREYERARPWLAELPPETVHAPTSKLALELGDFATAEAEAREAAKAAPVWWVQVGDALEAQGRYAEAVVAYDEFLKSGPTSLDACAAWNGKGDALLGLWSDPRPGAEEARIWYERGLAALRPDRSVRARCELAECEKDLGRLDERAGRTASAREHYRAALAALGEARASLPMDVLGDAFLGDSALLAVDGLLRTAGNGAAAAWESLAAIEAMRARGLLDWMLAPPRGAAFEELRARVAAVLLSAGPDVAGDRLRALEEERVRLGAGTRPDAPVLAPDTLRGLVAGEPETLFLVTWLDHGRGAESVANRARLWAFLGERAIALDLGSRGRADRLARAALAAVANPGGDPGPALREAAAFWLPGEVEALVANARKVVLCIDPADARLPFEALPCGSEPLGLRVPVERAPSLSVWQRLRYRAATGTRRIVLDSVPEAATDRALGLAPLRFSAREGELVATELRAEARLSGPDASLARLRTSIGSGGLDVLHLSAHAVAHPSLPTASSLWLADGPVPFASLREVPLGGALVVLSACTSAGNATRGGEGVVGLLWGPLAAGARGVVASLYDVNQQATSDLMAAFHAERAAGCTEPEALRRARARLAATANYAHPHYWAGFAAFTATTVATPLAAWREAPLWGAALCVLLASALFLNARRSLPG